MTDNSPEQGADDSPPAPAKAAEFVAQEPVQVDETPAPAPAAAAPAVRAAAPKAAAAPQPYAGMSVDERAYQQYQNLSQAVLESAEIATRSAEAAVSVGGQLKQATRDLRELADSGHKKARLLLAIAGGVMVVCTLFYLVMGVRMVSRLNKLDVMTEALGKRVVELNTAMESLESLNKGVQELAARQAELTKSQSDIEGRIEAQLKQSESVFQKVPTETAKQVAASSDSLLKQVQGINARLQSQANAVQNLGNEVKALKGASGNVESLRKDVETLVTMQKERQQAPVPRSAATAPAERPLQYPRVPAVRPGETSAPAASAVPSATTSPVKP
jgi:DNA repair exonuclease SbcCD ATPase subunit